MKKYNKGFTLIELLVVIAIIGILSSVVLVSLGTARSKGSDAAIKSDLSGVRSQAEVYASDNGNTYGGKLATAGVCPTAAGTMFYDDVTIRNAISHAKTQGPGGAGLNACQTDNPASGNATKWAIVSQLRADTKTAWCVDSTGKSKQVSDATDYTQTTMSAELSGGSCVE